MINYHFKKKELASQVEYRAFKMLLELFNSECVRYYTAYISGVNQKYGWWDLVKRVQIMFSLAITCNLLQVTN